MVDWSFSIGLAREKFAVKYPTPHSVHSRKNAYVFFERQTENLLGKFIEKWV
jgi:hypothetical protein